MRSLAILSLALVFGCTCHEASPDLEATAASWPAADRLFHAEPRWLGGDAAFSVDLGGGRSLWLFGDSFVATSAALKRSESTMVRNSVAIQQGSDPSSAKMTFHWREDVGTPGSFFPEEGEAWYWPGHGVRLGSSLLLFLSRVVKDPDPGSLGFRAAGWEARRVESPDAPASTWTLARVPLPAVGFDLVGGLALLVEGDWLYAYGVREPESHDVVLERWPRARAMAGDLSAPEWWMGKDRGWVAQSVLGNERPAVLFRGSTELSVHRDSGLGRYIQVQTEGFGAAELVLRSAARPEGPWSAAQRVFRPPESDRGGKVIVYAGKAHPQLSGGGLAATYAANSLDLNELVRDATLYYPRFVKIGLTR